MPRNVPLDRLRRICLAFPEAHEVEAWGAPTFRVRNKLFAMYAAASDHHGGGRNGVWIKATHITQDHLIHSHPERYFRPPYVGPSGWVGAWLDHVADWHTVAELLHDAFVATAPKRVSATLSHPATGVSARTKSGPPSPRIAARRESARGSARSAKRSAKDNRSRARAGKPRRRPTSS